MVNALNRIEAKPIYLFSFLWNVVYRVVYGMHRLIDCKWWKVKDRELHQLMQVYRLRSRYSSLEKLFVLSMEEGSNNCHLLWMAYPHRNIAKYIINIYLFSRMSEVIKTHYIDGVSGFNLIVNREMRLKISHSFIQNNYFLFLEF